MIIVIIICFLIACQFEIYRWQSTSADILGTAERNFNCGGGGGGAALKTRDASLLEGGGLLPHKIFEIYRLGNGIFNILNEAFPLTTSTWIRCKMKGTSSAYSILILKQKHFSSRKVRGSQAPPRPPPAPPSLYLQEYNLNIGKASC